MDLEFLEEEMLGIARLVEPSPAQRSAARTSQRAIRAALDTGNMARRITADYLSGSYARQTAIAPIDDVDIIFVIDPEKWKKPLLGGYPEPERVLETFLGAIRLRRESSLVRMQRRSVGLKMQHLDIDAVPAIETERDGFILIPDKNAGEWILTAPRVHAERATEVNQARGNRFKPLVKVLKSWNARLPKKAAFKSFSIETMALHLFATTPFHSMFEGALKFFDFLSGQFAEDTHFDWRGDAGIGLARPCWEYTLFDVASTGSNLFANLSDERRDAFMAKALVTRDLLWKANGARSEDRCREFIERALIQ